LILDLRLRILDFIEVEDCGFLLNIQKLLFTFRG